MSEIAANEGGDVFENYLKLSYKDQFRVMSHLSMADRIRYSFASRLACLQSAFLFIDYYGFELYGFSATSWRIYAVKNEYVKNSERRYGVILDLVKDKESSYVRCSEMNGTELWEEDLGPKVDIFKLAVGYFRAIMTVHKNRMKKLVICGHNLSDVDFKITAMKELESLEIDGDADVHQFLPKITHSLKHLVVRSRSDGISLSRYRQIYHVTDCLHLTYTSLTYKQFRKLRSRRVCFSIGDLTPQDIYQFINAFKEVDFYEEFGEYQWNTRYSGFDVQELFTLLKIDEKEAKEEFIEIRQVSFPKKMGELSITKSTIKFAWDLKAQTSDCGKDDKKSAE